MVPLYLNLHVSINERKIRLHSAIDGTHEFKINFIVFKPESRDDLQGGINICLGVSVCRCMVRLVSRCVTRCHEGKMLSK